MSLNRTFLSAFIAVSLAGALAPAQALPVAGADTEQVANDDAQPVAVLAAGLMIGDLVFIRVPVKPFRKVAAATGSWTNHVGVVTEVGDGRASIAESTFPFSRSTPLARFVARSEGGRVAVMRLRDGLTAAQQAQVKAAAGERMGIFYDTGFDLHSHRQFCSRFAHEVLLQASGTRVGTVETFAALFARQPDADLAFWKLWYFGRIPWQRETITPASLLRSAAMRPVFDGTALPDAGRARDTHATPSVG